MLSRLVLRKGQVLFTETLNGRGGCSSVYLRVLTKVADIYKTEYPTKIGFEMLSLI